MKNVLMMILTVATLKAQAHEFHTPNYCHAQNKNFCAHLGYSTHPNTQDAFEFVVDLVAPRAHLGSVQSLEVKPIMRTGHEHGTSPVSVTRLDLNHFQVSDAYLMMPGEWIIQVYVNTTSGQLLIEIPLQVE